MTTTSTAVLRATAVTWRRGRARRRTMARCSSLSLRGACCTPRPEAPKAWYHVAARGNSIVPRKTRAVQHRPPSGPAAPRRGYVQWSDSWNLMLKLCCHGYSSDSRQAVCCSDQKHCCPAGFSCGLKSGSCVQDLSSWDVWFDRAVRGGL